MRAAAAAAARMVGCMAGCARTHAVRGQRRARMHSPRRSAHGARGAHRKMSVPSVVKKHWPTLLPDSPRSRRIFQVDSLLSLLNVSV